MDPLLKNIHEELGIDSSILENYKLPLCKEPNVKDLEVVDIDIEGRPFVLVSSAAQAWREMVEAARKDRIPLLPYSGFRSYVYQKQILKRKLDSGHTLESILTENAIPGYSEHHTGRAVDISESRVLETKFELTESFTWLTQNASKFNFYMSYPKDNTKGIIYEPWHWCYKE